MGNSDHLLPLFESQNVKDENGDAVGTDLRVLVREGVTSL